MEGITEKNTKAEIFEAYQLNIQAFNDLTQRFKELEVDFNNLKKINSDLSESFEKNELRIKELEFGVNQVTPETSLVPERVTVCIPYVKNLAQGNELQLALRGWAQNFKQPMNIVVIGDREDWMNDLVHVIECERISNNPPLDVVNKMMLAINSDQVTEKFIWANDDQYLISPCILADFETLKCTGKLGDKSIGSTLYQQNKKRTADLLIRNNQSNWDFSSHTPFVFEKEKLEKMITELNMTEEPYLVATVYFNSYFPGFIPYECEGPIPLEHDNFKVGVYRQNADLDRLKNLMTKKKLISNSESGWTEKLSEILNSFFSFKCRFEN